MKLCKINLKEIISFAFMIGIICFFKTIYINSITYTSYSDLVSNILIFLEQKSICKSNLVFTSTYEFILC